MYIERVKIFHLESSSLFLLNFSIYIYRLMWNVYMFMCFKNRMRMKKKREFWQQSQQSENRKREREEVGGKVFF